MKIKLQNPTKEQKKLISKLIKSGNLGKSVAKKLCIDLGINWQGKH